MNYKNLRGNKSARRTRFAVFYGFQEKRERKRKSGGRQWSG